MDSRILRLLDAIIGRLAYFAIFLPLQIMPKGKGGILVIKLWALGDTLAVLPAVKALKIAFPGKKVTALCTKNNVSVFEHSGMADEIITLDYKSPRSVIKTFGLLLRGKFSLALDFEPYSFSSAVLCAMSRARERIGFAGRKLLYTKSVVPQNIHVVKNFMKIAFAAGCEKKYPESMVRLETPGYAESKARFIVQGKTVGMHVGSGSSSGIRRWGEQNFARLADMLSEKFGAAIVLVGTEKDAQTGKKVAAMMKTAPINVAGKTDLITLAACMKRMSLVIANDSGPMHLSAAMGTPTLGLFGPNKPELYGPYGTNSIALYKGPIEPYIKPFKGKFPEKYREEYDVNKITVEEAFSAASKLLLRGNTRP